MIGGPTKKEYEFAGFKNTDTWAEFVKVSKSKGLRKNSKKRKVIKSKRLRAGKRRQGGG